MARSRTAKRKVVCEAPEAHQRGGKLAVMQRHFGAMCGPADLSTNKIYRRSWKIA